MALIQGRKVKERALKNSRYTWEKVHFDSTPTVSRCVVVTINIIIIIKVDQKVLLRLYRNFICHYQAPPHLSNCPKSVSSQAISCLGHFIWSISSKRWLHHPCSDLLHVHLLSMCNSVWTVGSIIGVAPVKTASSDISIFLL
jgi:hypothetical protein